MEILISSKVLNNYLSEAKSKKTNMVIFLMNGFQMKGRIKDFDDMSVIIETDGTEQLVFRHAISTIRPLGGSGSTSW